jgi:hypothetical protein
MAVSLPPLVKVIDPLLKNSVVLLKPDQPTTTSSASEGTVMVVETVPVLADPSAVKV